MYVHFMSSHTTVYKHIYIVQITKVMSTITNLYIYKEITTFVDVHVYTVYVDTCMGHPCYF